jgi:hypothetical protein
MFCKDCGATIPDGARFCRQCGSSFSQDDYANGGQALKAEPPGHLPYSQQPPPQQQAPPPQQQAPQQQAPPRRAPPPPQQQTPPPVSFGSAPPQAPHSPGKKGLSPAIIALIVAVPVVLIAGAIIMYMFVLKDGGKGQAGKDASTTLAAIATTAETTTAKATTAATTAEKATTTTETTTEATTTAETTKDIDSIDITYTYLTAKPEPKVAFNAVDGVFPSLYRSQDYLVTFTGSCEYGQMDVMLEVEVPGFTQQYKQKLTLDRKLTKLRIVPPLLTGDLNLRSEKTAQLTYSVTDLDSGKILVHDSKGILLYSKFDMIWYTKDFKDMNRDNILAWMTPEAPGVLELKRNAIDYLEYISDGAINAIVGYQDYGVFDNYIYNTWVQAVAIQGAMSDINGVRYNNSSFSIDKDVHQRILAPDDVLDSKSGLCIETALVMASALQSAGMHCMLVLPPGHAQVAVETWPNTGDYFLIETTVLPMERDMDTWDYVVSYMDKDDWFGYIGGYGYNSLGECYVLDCDLGKTLAILPMTN